jgi:hypothetical protein
MENEIGYQLPSELIAVRENVRRIIKDEVIPAEARVDPDAAEIDEDDYWRIARKVQAAEAVSATLKRGMICDKALASSEMLMPSQFGWHRL